MTTILLLARHGETAENAQRVFQGQGGGPLNERGRAQAERLASRIANEVDVIVSSDLLRARETAQFAASASNAALTLDRALREVDVGAWTGLSYEEVVARFPDEWNAWRAGVDVPRGGGETYEHLAQRITTALVRIANAHAGKRVLVVSHGAALRSAICSTLGLVPRWSAPLGALHNAAVSTLHYGDGPPRVVTYNDSAHLAGLDPPLT